MPGGCLPRKSKNCAGRSPTTGMPRANEVRIRFITAQDSGKDYMLYSRRTEDDFTLSLMFAGTTPLRDIRRQGQRLVDALVAVPEAPAAESQPLLATCCR